MFQKVWAYPYTCETTTTNKLVNLSVVPFCLFILFMGISWQEYWNGLLFPPPVGHVLSELFTLTYLSWVTLHGMPHWIMQAPLPGQGCDLWRGSFKKRWQEYTEELYKKRSDDLDNHDGVVTYLEPDILECEVTWALGSITMNKASGGDGISAELFQIQKGNAV